MFRRRDVAELFDDESEADVDQALEEDYAEEGEMVDQDERQDAPRRSKMTLADHFAQQARPFDQGKSRRERPTTTPKREPEARMVEPEPTPEPAAAPKAPARAQDPSAAQLPASPSVPSTSASPAATAVPPQAVAPATSTPNEATSGDKRVLTVGPETCLKGEISRCDRVVIEGQVDAEMSDVNALEIVEGGRFNGSAKLGSASISGSFEGTLQVSGLLVIDSSGIVTGNVTYGELEIRRGGRMTGEVNRTSSSASSASQAE